jgi:hypothetical protein
VRARGGVAHPAEETVDRVTREFVVIDYEDYRHRPRIVGLLKNSASA